MDLRRRTTGGSYIPEIDGVRFIAILSVVLYHIAIQATDSVRTILFPSVHYGLRGVEVFFALSGFILGLPFAKQDLLGGKKVRISAYFLRRLTRLEPPYIVLLLLRFALLVGAMHVAVRALMPHFLATLGYVHSMVYGKMSSINPPVWSLEVEVQFYCLAPILALVAFRGPKNWRRAGFLAVILALSIAQLWIGDVSRVRLSLLGNLQYFLAGFLVCDLYLTDWKRIPSHWGWDVIGLAAWGFVFGLGGTGWTIWSAVFIAIGIVSAFKGPIGSWFLSLPAISIIGGMCYSIYLTHNLVLSSIVKVWRLGIPAGMVLELVAVGVVGLGYYMLLERPCMDKDWPSKLWSRLTGRKKEDQITTVEAPEADNHLKAAFQEKP
ncbi:acyltransferase family protein [Acidicapsa dinghuensis]|uniref:Acyltransferase family protein n=1 Tax=Acidicapsa dinghuensis TaxID=2218256 RepID=A0ABW1EMR2_9BACT|nr:acyltransferase [Acidicapsa dinghuensis]